MQDDPTLYNLVKTDFHEYTNIFEKLIADKEAYSMLSEYNECKNVLNEFSETDVRRNEYKILDRELRDEIIKKITRVIANQY